MMREGEGWSINALSDALGPDRRTISRWLERAGVTPAAEGPRGPMYRLRDAVGVLADAGLLGDRDRATAWRWSWGAGLAVREYAGRVRRVLRKRFGDEGPPRIMPEVLADELAAYLAEVEARMRGKRFKRGESPAWPSMSERVLDAALRLLIQNGDLPDGDAAGERAEQRRAKA